MTTTTTKTWTIEHKWTCGHCQHVNPGRNDECANCGKPIDSTHVETVPADMSYENRVQDTTRFDDKRPDWVCLYCDARNPAGRNDCKQCGSRKGEAKGEIKAGQDTTEGGDYLPRESPFESLIPRVFPPVSNAHALKQTTPVSNQGPYREPVLEEYVPPTTMERVSNWVTENFPKIIGGMAALLGLAALVASLVWFFSWHDTTAQVAETRWNYHVSLHQREIRHDRDWRDHEPAHSFNEVCHTEIRSHHNCNPHNCNPHPESYSCNCRTVTSCRPTTSCRTTCSSSGNRSSSCSESCTTSQSCSSSQECSTCSRTVYDTCWDRCPDYDQMCDYDYPAWPERSTLDTTNTDHTPVRPALSAPGNVSCPSDAELLTIQNAAITQCTVDTIGYTVQFNAGEAGNYTQHPDSLTDYNLYQTGARWNAQYNHAGMFRILSRQ